MGEITSLFAHKVAGQVSPGVETRDALKSLGLQPESSVESSRMVAAEAYYEFFADLARLDPDGLTLPLRVGASMRCDDYGAFGFAWKTASTLRDSYERAEQFGRRLTNVSTYSVENVPDGAFFQLHRAGERHLGLRLSNEATIASIAAISQEVSETPFVPRAVSFKHEAPGHAEAHEAHFGCPVEFGADRDALLVSAERLAVKNRLSDKSLSTYFDRQLEDEIANRAREDALDQQVRHIVAQRLSDGAPTLSNIAEALGIGARTLQRRLADGGHSFQSVIDAARRELSHQLLRETDYSLAEIAFLTGFAEQSGFTRAFKRWSGQTPRSYRLAAQQAT